eukprot:14091254-Alexandrium_andersonii.AAC.1
MATPPDPTGDPPQAEHVDPDPRKRKAKALEARKLTPKKLYQTPKPTMPKKPKNPDSLELLLEKPQLTGPTTEARVRCQLKARAVETHEPIFVFTIFQSQSPSFHKIAEE